MNIKEANLSYLASAVSATGLEVSGQKRNFFISKIHNWKLQSAASVVLFVSAACGGGEEAVATRSGNSQANPEPIKAELTAAATATSIPTIVVETPRPMATTEAVKECPPMPQSVKAYYDDLIRLNNSGILKDATTGGPLSEANMKRSFLDPIEKAACVADPSNKIREDFDKFTNLVGTLSPLAAQFYATNRNFQIAEVALKITTYLQNAYPALYVGTRSVLLPSEFTPPHLVK